MLLHIHSSPLYERVTETTLDFWVACSRFFWQVAAAAGRDSKRGCSMCAQMTDEASQDCRKWWSAIAVISIVTKILSLGYRVSVSVCLCVM